jgi:hypothetical protein
MRRGQEYCLYPVRGFGANKDVLKGQKTTAKLEKVLQEVSKFVVECKESNVRLGNLVEASLAGAIERNDDMDRATRH